MRSAMLLAKLSALFASLHRAESRWLAIHGKPRSSHATSPVFHAPAHKFEFPLGEMSGPIYVADLPALLRGYSPQCCSLV
jgi:hypothetical protein